MAFLLFDPDPRLPRFTTTLAMEGSRYLIRFSWNQRLKGWYFDARDEEDRLLIAGERISVNSLMAYGSEFTPLFVAGGRDDHRDFEDWARRRMTLFHVTRS